MLTPAEAKTLKAKIKAEMQRRNAHGSLVSYADPAYDFVEQPTTGQVIQAEHGQKTIDLLLQIAPHTDLVPVESGGVIPDGFDTELISYVDALAREHMVGASSCVGLCTGLCTTTCTTSCTSCRGCTSCDGCTGTCYGCTSCTSCTSCSGCTAKCTGCTGCSVCDKSAAKNCTNCTGPCGSACAKGAA